MCGRYYADDTTLSEIRKIVNHVEEKLYRQKMKGEIYPTNTAPIIFSNGRDLIADSMKWGFPRFDKKGVLINARAETILERKTFKQSALQRRCIVPANCFYEWDHDKNKIAFTQNLSNIIYMAGIYNQYGEDSCFVIITTQANHSISDIHDRMPLIMGEEEIRQWIEEDAGMDFTLHKVPPSLIRNSSGTSFSQKDQ